MQKSEIKIFIVEEDQTMAKAMEAAVKSLGMQPVVCPTPDEALNQFRIRGAQFFVIDCLLPKKSGVDLAVQLRTLGGADVPIVLTSGIYKDKTFSKDALHKTGALAFLPKPFNIKELTDLILKSTQGMA